MGLTYTDFDLILLSRMKECRTLFLSGEDVRYFKELAGALYPNLNIRVDAEAEPSSYDLLLFGDSVILGALSEIRKQSENSAVCYAISKNLSLDFCSNQFIRYGYEILGVETIRETEGGEKVFLLFHISPHREGDSFENGELFPKYNTVYALCPRNVKSGGAELIHQIVYNINKLGGNAFVTYVNAKGEELLTHPELEKYVYGKVRIFEEIEDLEENLIIIPEGWPIPMDFAKKAKKAFWWLSVDNFKAVYKDDEKRIQEELKRICRDIDMHFYQSEYAKQYVMPYNKENKPLFHLADYLNDTFLCSMDEALKLPKKDLVLYNPKKGIEFTKKLIDNAHDISWTPIENMTTDQVRDLLRSAKVYIDFGNHPGKDRIPREAAVSGCIVITGKRGSAAYKEDVDIPEKYKIPEEKVEIEDVLDLIHKCLIHYNTRIGDFAAYREKILGEKAEFLSDIQRIFFV